MLDTLNFTTEVADIFDAKGNRIPTELGRGVYRKDTGELLSICGPSFRPVQHRDVVMPVLDQLDAMGYDLQERTADQNALYDLKGRKGAFVSSSLAKNGAIMRTDLILGDFVEPTGENSSFLAKGPDTMFTRLSLLNAHDGSMAVNAVASHLRLVCLNGMTSADWSVNTKAKHTSGVNIEGLKARIINSLSAATDPQNAERFATYARTKVNAEQAQSFFEKTVAKAAAAPDGTARFSKSLVDTLLRHFRAEDQTVWGLWNALTAWATHSPAREGSSPLTTTLRREGLVAGAMRSKPWQALLAA